MQVDPFTPPNQHTPAPVPAPPPEPMLCACQPGAWEFTLDFARLDCSDTFLQKSGGLKAMGCTATPPSPTSQLHMVSLIQIQEFDSEYEWLMNPWTFDGPLFNGHAFSYTSLMMPLNPKVAWSCTPDTCLMPATLNIHLFGKTYEGADQEYEIYWAFSNTNCMFSPIVSSGDYIGPVTVVRILLHLSRHAGIIRYCLCVSDTCGWVCNLYQYHTYTLSLALFLSCVCISLEYYFSSSRNCSRPMSRVHPEAFVPVRASRIEKRRYCISIQEAKNNYNSLL